VARVDARLAELFAQKREEARRTSPEAEALVSAVADLTMRGGKRLRPAALYAGFVAVCAEADERRTLEASAALELLQSYFLIQDDWMDNDAERRGAPSVHVALAQKIGDAKLGANLAILASDLAAGFAWELLALAPFPKERIREATSVFARTHFEVVCGQQLDLLGHHEVGLVHQLKTGSYTVRGPLQLGALLANASAPQLSALERFGTPLGLAFQLRDDLLGTFGQATGKPIGNDLRAGKHTTIVTEARASLAASQLASLDAVLGCATAEGDAVAQVTQMLIDTGVRARLEARACSLVAEANAALDHAAFSARGKRMLAELADKLALRKI
jgi:geranylgeranyl diphosphate synthase type I